MASSAPMVPTCDSSATTNVQVVVRCRPATDAEKRSGDCGLITCNQQSSEVHVVAPAFKNRLGGGVKKTFTFDQCYGGMATQEQIFRKTVKPLVDQVLAGYFSTIFAYGKLRVET